MQWYYVENGNQAGPVSEEQLREFARSGKIQMETLVWKEGMSEWAPYSKSVSLVRHDPPGVQSSSPAGGNVCVECGKSFPKEEMIAFKGKMVCATCKPTFFKRIEEGAGLTGELELAGILTRFGADFIDGFILLIPVVVLMGLVFGAGFLSIFTPHSKVAEGVGIAVQLIWQGSLLVGYLLYNGLFLAKYSATPGKMICRIKVVTPDGEPLSTGKAWGRAGAEYLTSRFTCGIGYLIALFDDEKRTLHDRICNTRVVRNG